MHELVILVSDLYVSQETPERDLPVGVALPGLQHAARFGVRSKSAGGWRSALARWLTGHDAGAPGAVAAVTLQAPANDEAVIAALATASSAGPTGTQAAGAQPPIAWMATPVHLVAGLTSVHLDRRSILRLDASDQSALAADFQRVFHDSGFELRSLDSGDFLVLGPHWSRGDVPSGDLPLTETLEPARAMGTSIADAQRADVADRALRRLGAEIEMWLHDHAVNDARSRRGELPITGLWLWGGGPTVDTSAESAPARRNAPTGHSGAIATAPLSDIAFGRDAYLQGLWAARGEKVFPLPQQLAEVFGYPQARRAVLAIQIGPMLHSNPMWTFFEALAQIDRCFITPAIDALNRGQCKRLVILANDYQLTLRARDRMKFWRRTPPGLSGLQ